MTQVVKTDHPKFNHLNPKSPRSRLQEAWKKSWWPEIARPDWTWEGLRFCVPPYHLSEDSPSKDMHAVWGLGFRVISEFKLPTPSQYRRAYIHIYIYIRTHALCIHLCKCLSLLTHRNTCAKAHTHTHIIAHDAHTYMS